MAGGALEVVVEIVAGIAIRVFGKALAVSASDSQSSEWGWLHLLAVLSSIALFCAYLIVRTVTSSFLPSDPAQIKLRIERSAIKHDKPTLWGYFIFALAASTVPGVLLAMVQDSWAGGLKVFLFCALPFAPFTVLLAYMLKIKYLTSQTIGFEKKQLGSTIE